MLMLTALSLGAGGGAGFLPAMGRLAGGAGGVGLAPLTAGRGTEPFVDTPFDRGGGSGTDRVVTGGGGGGGGAAASSFRYADGAHPFAEPSSFWANHQPVYCQHPDFGSYYRTECKLTIALFLSDIEDLVLVDREFDLALAFKVIEDSIGILRDCRWFC